MITIKRTYIDANVLIAAFQGDDDTSRRAIDVLDDPSRRLIISDYLRLEVLPKPTFHRLQEEIEFMQVVLEGAAEEVLSSPDITTKAVDFASKYDMAPMDALHAGAAAAAAVDELITMEKPEKPICKVQEIRVTSIYSKKKVL